MPIDHAALKIRRELGSGGFGTVHEVDTPHGLVPEPVCAFKEFKNANADELANLAVLVRYRRQLDPTDRRLLDELTTWPLDTVTSANGTVVGYLMRLVPSEFVETSIAQVNAKTTVMRSIDWLAHPDHSRRNGASVVIDENNLVQRLWYCAWVARVFHFLHHRNIVYGDLSLTNILYSESRATPILLIDIDPVRIDGQSPAVRQATSPGMRPPEAKTSGPNFTQNLNTDRFKLARLLYNILGSALRVDPQLQALDGKVDVAGMQMFAAGLGADAANRPTAHQWYRYFFDRYTALIQPPKITRLTVTPPHALVGQNVTVEWDVDGHQALELTTPTGERRRIGVSAPNELRVTLPSSGQFVLTATNSHGTSEYISDIVYAVEPPRVEWIGVPAIGQISRAIIGIDIDIDQLAHVVDPGRDLHWVDDLLSHVAPPPLPPTLNNSTFLIPQFSGLMLDEKRFTRLLDAAMSTAEQQALIPQRSTSTSHQPPRG